MNVYIYIHLFLLTFVMLAIKLKHLHFFLDVLVENMESVDKCISRISLKLEQEWPLHILFTPESMERYNELFRFLLRIRLLQLQLLSIWTETKRMFRFIFRNGPAQLLINMTYFVNNLQYYLQVYLYDHQAYSISPIFMLLYYTILPPYTYMLS
jgi:hypothetical protein